MHNYNTLVDSIEHVVTQVAGALERATDEKPNRFFSPWKYRYWNQVVSAAWDWIKNTPVSLNTYRELDRNGLLTDEQKDVIATDIISYIHDSYEIFEDLFYLVYKDDYTVSTLMDSTYSGWSISKT